MCCSSHTSEKLAPPPIPLPPPPPSPPLLFLWQLNDASHIHDLAPPSKHTHSYLLSLPLGDAFKRLVVVLGVRIKSYLLQSVRSLPPWNEGCPSNVVETVVKSKENKESRYFMILIYSWTLFVLITVHSWLQGYYCGLSEWCTAWFTSSEFTFMSRLNDILLLCCSFGIWKAMLLLFTRLVSWGGAGHVTAVTPRRCRLRPGSALPAVAGNLSQLCSIKAGNPCVTGNLCTFPNPAECMQ